jgi:methyl-accepting chemotaxis protein
MNVTLKKKLVLAFLASTILPILLICTILGYNIKRDSMDTFYQSTGKELSHVETAMSIFMEEIRNNITMAAQHPDMVAADESISSFIDITEPKSPLDFDLSLVEQRMINMFKSFKSSHKHYLYAYMGTPFGGYTYGLDTYKTDPGYDPRTRPWYTDALANRGNPTITKAYNSTEGGAMISVSHTVQGPDGSLKGVLAFDVTLGALSDFIDGIKIGESGYVMLVQDDGVILADPSDGDNLFKQLGSVNGGAFTQINNLSSGDLLVNIKGVDYAVKVMSSKDLGWKLVGLIKKSEIMGKVRSMLSIMVVVGVVLAALFGVCAYFLAASLARPIAHATNMIKDIAEGEGDLTRRLEVETRDEVGELARWVNVFLDNLQAIIKELAVNVGVVDISSATLLDISNKMAEGARSTSALANGVASSTEEMNANMASVASTMEETTGNTNVVAAATEQMTSTINEIAVNSEKARDISEKAVVQVAGASEKMNQLGKAARAIGAVTETITDISEQTNLLALNATIEAARAGDAGKGFAVVANEIKELARQTADATSDIKAKIDGVQGTSSETVVEIDGVARVMNDINDIIATIATAIEEQSAATGEISSNVGQVSQGIQDVNENVTQSSTAIGEISQDIAMVDASASEMSRNSNGITENVGELKQMAVKLNEIVGRFKY